MKSLKIISIYFLFFSISILRIYAQQTGTGANNIGSLSETVLKNLTPVSPTAFQFLKFGDIPVSEYTGSPNIDIPIFNIEVKGFSVPLALKYYSKGIRVAEEADWVGLGWDLSFASITQIVNDKDDLSSSINKMYSLEYLPSNNPAVVMWNSSKPNFTYMNIDETTSTNETDLGLSYVTYQYRPNLPLGLNYPNRYIPDFVTRKDYDFERDIYVVNLFGEQLYILCQKNSTRVFEVMNKKGYKVSMDSNNNWTVTNPSGVTFQFKEMNVCYTLSTNGGVDTYDKYMSNEFKGSNGGYATGTYSRTWQITQIKTVYGDCIDFRYSPEQGALENSESYPIRKVYRDIHYYIVDRSVNTQQGPFDSGFCSVDCGPLTYGLTPPFYIQMSKFNDNGISESIVDEITMNGTSYNQQKTYLSSISYNGNNILFSTSSRTDWTNARKIDNIIIKNIQGEAIKTVEFKYTYFDANISGKKKTDTSRLRLDSFSTQKDEKYIFSYNPIALPAKDSYATDFWGYYNGKNSNLNPFINITDFDPYYLPVYKDVLKKHPTVKYAVSDYCKAGILEKIQYPTGGYSRFSYSLNNFDNYSAPTDPSAKIPNQYSGNGLKIDSIINYDQKGDVLTAKKYQYEGGKLQLPLSYFYEQNQNDYIKVGDNTYYHLYLASAGVLNIYTTPRYSPGLLGDGNGVGYSKVTVSVIDYKTKTQNGKTVTYYQNTPAIIKTPTFDNGTLSILSVTIPSYHKGIANGSFLKQEIYNNTEMVKTTTCNYWISKPMIVDYGTRISYLGIYGTTSETQKMLVAYYPIYKTETLLRTNVITDKLDGKEVVTTESYSYDPNFNMLTSKNITTSNIGKSKTEEYYYPFNRTNIINNTPNSDKQNLILGLMHKNNRLNEKIGIINKTIKNKVENLVSTQYIEYRDTVLLPEIFKSSIGKNQLESELVLKYDTYNNIVEKIDRNNTSTCYLWSYGGQYKIAEIKNATYNEVKKFIDAEALSKALVPDMSKVSALRQSLPNALISTYTYKPLVGMLTATDARAVTTYYTYDTAGRLTETYIIENGIKKVLQSNSYHYSN